MFCCTRSGLTAAAAAVAVAIAIVTVIADSSGAATTEYNAASDVVDLMELPRCCRTICTIADVRAVVVTRGCRAAAMVAVADAADTTAAAAVDSDGTTVVENADAVKAPVTEDDTVRAAAFSVRAIATEAAATIVNVTIQAAAAEADSIEAAPVIKAHQLRKQQRYFRS